MPRKSIRKRFTRIKNHYLKKQKCLMSQENKHLGDHNYYKFPDVGDTGNPQTCSESTVAGSIYMSHLPYESETQDDIQTWEDDSNESSIEMCEDEELIDVQPICADVQVSTSLTEFQTLQTAIAEDLQLPFQLMLMENVIQIIEFYQTRNTSVKLSVNIEADFTAKIFVHRIEVSDDHEIWDGLPKKYNCVNDIKKLLSKLQTYSVCIANPDPEFQEFVPIGKELSSAESSTNVAYRESDFGAVKGDVQYSSTIRSVHCCMLVQGARCKHCSRYRGTLRERKQRQEERKKMGPQDFISSKVRHTFYSKSELMEKINQQKQKIKEVEHKNWKLQLET